MTSMDVDGGEERQPQHSYDDGYDGQGYGDHAGYGDGGGYGGEDGYHEGVGFGGEEVTMDLDDLPVTQEDAWAVIRWVWNLDLGLQLLWV